jgi:PKD repeat protein
VLTSTLSQANADSLVPAYCEALSAKNLLLLGLADGTGATTNVANTTSTLELRNIPSVVLVVPSSIVVQDSIGQTYTLTVDSDPLKLAPSPSLPFATSFTVVGGTLNLKNAPTISLVGKAFRTVFVSSNNCWNGDYLTSSSSQTAADLLIPHSCASFNAAEDSEIKFGASANLGSSSPTPTLTLLNVPPGATVGSSTLSANDKFGHSYSLGVSQNTITFTATPLLPFGSTFTISSGTLNFTNAPSITLSGRTFQTAPVPQGPNSVIVANVAPYFAGTNLGFNGSSSTAPDSTIVRYDWSFGDGTIGSGALVSHYYGTVGVYVVALTVTDNFARRSTNTVTLNIAAPILNQPPVARITPLPGAVPSLGYVAGSPMFLSPLGTSDPDGSIVSYFWEFGDGTNRLLSTPDAVPHTYNVSGTYSVQLTVTDNSGLSNSKSINLVISQ